MISKIISIDIIHFLLESKGFTKESLSESMGISVEDINKVLKSKIALSQEHIDTFSKNEEYKIWQLMYDAIPLNHLSKKAREKIELCRLLSKRLRKK